MIITILYLKKNNAIKHIIQTIVTKFNIAIINKQNNANGTVKTHKKIKRNKKKLKYKTDPINLKFYIIKNKDIITKTIPKKISWWKCILVKFNHILEKIILKQIISSYLFFIKLYFE